MPTKAEYIDALVAKTGADKKTVKKLLAALA